MGYSSRKEHKEKVEINRIHDLVTKIGDQGQRHYSQDLERIQNELKRWMGNSNLEFQVSRQLLKK